MKRTVKLSIVSTLAFILMSAIAPRNFAVAQTATDKAAKIDQLMTEYFHQGVFNGSVLVAERGRVIFKKGYGFADMEWEIPNTTDTKFRLGSITKQFTATLILQLVEQGKIKLDARMTDYLSDYRKDTGDRVTIHHLLTHTSGIPSYTGLPGFFKDVSRNPYTVTDFVKKYCSNDLSFEPGSKFAYNNSGYFLLGAIIEKITGKTYEQVLKENIFDPLGMKDTGYDHHDTILKKRAEGYERTPRGIINAPYLDMSLPYAAGSLYSTVEDLFLWDQALYTEKVLSARSKELMFKPNLSDYGYGWAIKTQAVGPKSLHIVEHGGGINGFNTLITRIVDDHHLIVLLNNTGGTKLGEMGREITNILYDQPFNLPRKTP